MQPTWKEGAWIPVFRHDVEKRHNGRSKIRGAHTSALLFVRIVAMRSGIQLGSSEAGDGVVESEWTDLFKDDGA